MTSFVTKIIVLIVAPLSLFAVYVGIILGDSINGDVIAYIGMDDNQQLARVHLYDLRTTLDIPLESEFQPAFRPRWSPDGEHLLFLTLVGQVQRLIVMEADGSRVRDVSPSNDRNRPIIEPRWLSNGEIVYLQQDGGQRYTYIVGSLVYNLPERLDDEDPRYAEYVTQLERDAGQLADDETDSVSLSLELIGGNQWAIVRWENGQRQILRNVADVTVQNRSVLVLSPDRQRVVFSDVVDGLIELLIMDTHGHNVHQITIGGGFDPVWQPR